MSKKGIWIALSLAVAQLCMPVAHAAMAQTMTAPDSVQNPEITFMEGLAHKLDVAIASAIILGRHDPEGANKTAEAIGLRALDPAYIKQVLDTNKAIKQDPALAQTSPLAKDIFPLKDKDTAAKERDTAKFAIEFLAAEIANHKEVATYCERRSDSDLCDAFKLIQNRVPSADID